MSNTYILACDERGTRNWPSSSSTWAFGGYIIAKSRLEHVEKSWKDIKLQLCGNAEVELKWSHFFPGTHQDIDNPLLSTNPREWKKQLFLALDKLCSLESFTPVTVISRKSLISEDEYDFYFEKSPKGNLLLRDGFLIYGVFGLFGLFLKVTNGKGEIWIDQLGSEKQQQRVQKNWENVQSSNALKKHSPENYKTNQRISRNIRFLDSSKEPAIQLADFLSGVIWAAAEGDVSFLAKYESTYAYSPILKKATLVKMP